MRDRWAPLIGLTGAHFVNDFYPFVLPLLLPFLVLEFGLSYLSAGILVASNLGAAVVLNPMVGHFADVYKKKKLILCFGLAFLAISTSALSFAQNYLTLFILCLLMGIGLSTYHPQATRFISIRYRKRMGKFMGIFGIGGSAGAFATAIILVPLISALGWRGAIFFLFIPGCLAAFILWRILREPKIRSSRGFPKVKIRPLILLSTIVGFRGFAFRGFLTFLPAYFIMVRGTTILEMGLLMALMLGTGIVAQPLGGAISDIIGRRKMFTISLSFLMLFLLAFTNSSGLISLVWLVLIGFCAYSTFPVGLAFASELVPAERVGMSVGFVFGSTLAFGAISTLMVGYLIDLSGFYWSFVTLSFFAGFAAILSLLLPRGQLKRVT